MSVLFQVHSLLRFAVLLAGLFMVVLCVMGLSGKQPFTKQGRIVGSVFAGLLHTQVLLGLGLVIGGLWMKRDIGHVVMMASAAALAQVMLSKNRRAATPGWKLPLIGVGGALLLILAGVMAIGRMPWTVTAL